MFQTLQKSFIAITVLLLLSAWTNSVNSQQKPLIDCQLNVSNKTLTNKNSWLSFQVTNLSAFPIELLTWYTAFEGFLSKLFVVKNNQQLEMEYLGPMIKRAEPHQDDYLLLAPGQVKAVEINLAQAYILPSGRYSVQLSAKPLVVKVNGVAHYVECDAEPLQFNVSAHQ